VTFTRLTRQLLIAASVAMPAALPSLASAQAPATRKRRGDDSDPGAGYTDPRVRVAPRRHRLRLGLEVWYVRLTRAQTADNPPVSQRFHLAPLGLDLAYQLQFFKWLMIRPAVAVGVNAGNTNTAMPALISPKIHVGFQGALLGIAVGYGYFTPFIYQGNAVDPVRGGLGQPIMLHSHHADGELSFTTRLDRGALSFIARFSMTNGKVWHFDIVGERSWRTMLTFNVGWYFGDGSQARQRKKRREELEYRNGGGR
jgi:hypothetical protein